MNWFKPTKQSPIGLHFDGDLVSILQLTGPPESRSVQAAARAPIALADDGSVEAEETAESIRRLLADHPFRGRLAIAAFGPSELFVQNVRLPDLPRGEWPAAVRSEAEERLPFPLEEAELRFLPAAELRQDGEIKQEVVMFAVHEPCVERFMEICRTAGLNLMRIDAGPTALLRSQREPAHEPQRRWATIEFGRGGATAAFAQGERLLFAKFLPLRGRELDEAVATAMNLSAAEARTMREVVTEAEQLDSSDDLHRTIVGAIRKPLEQLANEVGLCLRYFKVAFRGGPIEELTVAGSEATPWLTEYLSSRLGLTCRIADPFQTLSIVAPQARLGRPAGWTTAVGLATAEPISNERRAETFAGEPLMAG